MQMNVGGGGYRILVVDDYPDTVEVVCTLLEVLGHEAHGASSGFEALAMVERLHPDIALIDLSMPLLDGYETAEQLRHRHGASPYLVALTGWGRPEDRIAARLSGFDEFVVKPAVSDALTQMLELYRLHSDRLRRRSSKAMIERTPALCLAG